MTSKLCRGVNGCCEYREINGLGTQESPYREVNDVYIQDQYTETISLFMGENLADDLKFNSDINLDDETVSINSPTKVPVSGNFICVKENLNFSQMEITNVVDLGDNNYSISVLIPFDFEFTTAANICLQNCDLNKDGSSNSKKFYITPDGLDESVKWDLTTISIVMYHGSAGDDGS